MAKIVMWALWPSFLVAVAAVGVFFSVFDPAELPWFGHAGEVSPKSAHAIGFFFFWAIGASCALFALLLSRDTGKAG